MGIATLGGGCFWCTEAVFQRLRGVEKVISGYEGGSVESPTYQQICTGGTGHAEVIQVHFDETVLSFADLLRIFLNTHDPTTLNRQGNDVGTQYRSVIFFHDADQERIAQEVITEIDSTDTWPNPIVTEVSPTTVFYPAEDYHQDYFNNNASQPYCQMVVREKVNKFESLFADRAK